LFLGNKHTAPLVNIRVLILPAPHLKMQFSRVPDTIPPRAQVQVPVEVTCLSASRETAVLDFSYTISTLPVSILSFICLLCFLSLIPSHCFYLYHAITVLCSVMENEFLLFYGSFPLTSLSTECCLALFPPC
jgi:hypothetical protein